MRAGYISCCSIGRVLHTIDPWVDLLRKPLNNFNHTNYEWVVLACLARFEGFQA